MEYPSPLNKKGIRCLNPSGFGAAISEAYSVSCAVIIPLSSSTSILETCGHVGVIDATLSFPESVNAEILQAFANVEATLLAAGVKEGWQAVYKMTTYHVGTIEEQADALDEAMSKYLGGNRPAWTGVSVAKLSGGARIEMQVTAMITSSS